MMTLVVSCVILFSAAVAAFLNIGHQRRARPAGRKLDVNVACDSILRGASGRTKCHPAQSFRVVLAPINPNISSRMSSKVDAFLIITTYFVFICQFCPIKSPMKSSVDFAPGNPTSLHLLK